MIASLLYDFNHAALWHNDLAVWDRPMCARSLDRLLYLALHRMGFMGHEENRLLRKLVRPGMHVVDVGANIGLYTLLLAQLTGPDGSVIAFEPEPNLFAMLKENCARNQAHNVTIFQRALGAETGKVMLQRSAFNSGDNQVSDGLSASGAVEVEIARFDDVQPEAKPDFIKIDVQGYELDALRGMERALAASPKVRVLFEFCPGAIEKTGNRPDELMQFFEERDFSLFETHDAQLRALISPTALIGALSGGRYTNLLAARGSADG